MMKSNKIIIILLLIIIFIVAIIIYPVIKNEHYNNKILNDIYKNTDIKNIKYYNKDNNYYIVKDSENVYVFDLNYEEVYSINIDEIKESKLDLVYRRNNLYYEEKEKSKNKIIYSFYDVKTNDLVYQTLLGGK